MKKTLYRSKTDRIFFGVCGGIAEYFGIDSTLVRIITVLLLLSSHSIAILYLLLGLVIPENPSRKKEKPVVKLKNTSAITGGGLVIIGLLLLLDNLGLIRWSQVWPALLICLGVYILYNNNK